MSDGYTDSGDMQPDDSIIYPSQGPPTAQEREDWGNQAERALLMPDFGDGDPTRWWATVTLRLLAALAVCEQKTATDAAWIERLNGMWDDARLELQDRTAERDAAQTELLTLRRLLIKARLDMAAMDDQLAAMPALPDES